MIKFNQSFLTKVNRCFFAKKKKSLKVKEEKEKKKELWMEKLPKELVYEFEPELAFKIVKCHSTVIFNENVDLCVKLAIDSKRTDLTIRGTCVLPHVIGKTKKVCFYGANAEQNRRALEAGADMICTEEVIEDIKKEIFDFDVLYATKESINSLKPHARVLGPKGLFPNAKVNTLIPETEIGKLNRANYERCKSR